MRRFPVVLGLTLAMCLACPDNAHAMEGASSTSPTDCLLPTSLAGFLFREADHWVARGMACLSQHQARRAVVAFGRARELQPSHLPAALGLVAAWHQLRRPDTAIATWQRRVWKDPRSPARWLIMASMFEEQGQDDLAIVAYHQAIQLGASDAMMQVRLGFAALRVGKEAVAIAAFQAVIRDEPHLALGHEGLALAFARSEHYQEAIREYRLVLKLAPVRADLLVGLGEALVAMERYAQALDAYHQALRVEPHHRVAVQAITKLRRHLTSL
jgi:Tfp pilus assembly protein PilF